MLATNIEGLSVAPNLETTVCEWISDGRGYVIGFTGTGSFSAEFRMSIIEVDALGAEVQTKPQYIFHTSPVNRTAYMADRSFQVPSGHKVRLTVKHDAPEAQTFYGTILGGSY